MKKKYIIIVIIIGVIIGIYFFSNNKLNNIPKKFKVYFSNLQTSVINGGAFVPNTPEINSTSLKAYDILITEPGDYATYTFDIVNDGNVDVKLNDIQEFTPKCISLNIPENIDDEKLVCDNLEYKFFYTDTNKEVMINDILKANTKKNITIKVGYIGNKDLASTDGVQITLYDMNFIYDIYK